MIVDGYRCNFFSSLRTVEIAVDSDLAVESSAKIYFLLLSETVTPTRLIFLVRSHQMQHLHSGLELFSVP
jgi:hypothetical protein